MACFEGATSVLLKIISGVMTQVFSGSRPHPGWVKDS